MREDMQKALADILMEDHKLCMSKDEETAERGRFQKAWHNMIFNFMDAETKRGRHPDEVIMQLSFFVPAAILGALDEIGDQSISERIKRDISAMCLKGLSS